jgi:hypothetical protein
MEMAMQHPTEVEPESRLGIAVVYEDSVTGLLAKDIFNRALREMDLNRVVQWGLWRFDVLGLPEILAQAVAGARAADAIVVAGYGHTQWPVTMHGWLSLLGDGTPQSGCFATLLVRPQSHAAEAEHRREWLRQLAVQCGRKFLAKEVDFDHLTVSRLREKIHELAHSSIPAFRTSLRRVLTSPSRHPFRRAAPSGVGV